MREDLILDEKNPYRTLGLRKWATDLEIKRAYIRMVKKYNPEIYPDEFIIIRKAYDSVRSPERRAKVDIHLFNELPGSIGYKEIEKATDSLVKLNRQIRKVEEMSEGRPLAGDDLAQMLDLRRQRSLVYAEKGMWREAISEWSEVTKLDKMDRQSRKNLILAHARIGYYHALNDRFEEAMVHWREILERHPATVEILHNMAIVSTRMGNKQNERDFWGRTLRGWHARLRKESDNGYLKALIVETHKHFGGEFLNDETRVVGAMVEPEEEHDHEVHAMGDGMDKPPAVPSRTESSPHVSTPAGGQMGGGKVFEDFASNRELGLACLDRQNWDGAVGAFEKCLRERPDEIEVQNHLGWAYLNSGNVNRAFLMWRKAYRLDPKNKETIDNMCRGHMKVGKHLQKERVWNPALVHFKSILQMQPDNAQVHVEIGNTYMLKGDPASAVESWQKALTYDPKNRNVRTAIRKAKQLLR